MKKRISVITGGYGGMGRAIAKELGKETTLVLTDFNEEKLLAVKKDMEDLGYETYVFSLNIRDKNRVKELADYAASLGDIVNVIHTAGVSPIDTTADVVLSTNALGTIYMVNNFYPVIVEGGVMINFASVAAYAMEQDDSFLKVYDKWDAPDLYDRMMDLTVNFGGNDDLIRAGVAYCISKRFVIHFSQKNTLRFAKKGCRILSISPGSYLTPMHQKLIDNQPETAESQLEMVPCGRWGHPYEIAALTVFLCSSGAGYISGVDILADAGQTSNTFVSQI
jgi:NAD(P)-dependent dehydrogenase (short-subunit alcohol dehydrogenase family)